MKLKILVLILLSLTLEATGQSLYFEENRNNPLLKKNIIPLKNGGFIESIIDNREDNTQLRVNFFDREGKLQKSNTLSISKASFLGYVSDNKDHRFIFIDNNNSRLSIPTYDSNGKLLINRVCIFKETSKNGSIPYFDSTAYYTLGKKGGKYIYSKVNYQYDTVWSREISANVKSNRVSFVGKLDFYSFLILESKETSTRIVAINDTLGNIKYDFQIGEVNKKRNAECILFDNKQMQIVLAGIEKDGNKKSGYSERIFLMELNPEGKFSRKRYYNEDQINFKDDQYISNILSVSTTSIIENGEDYALVGENIQRTDFVGEGTTSKIITNIAFSAFHTPFPGVALPEVMKFSTQDLTIFFPLEDDKLLIKKIDKQPIEKYFPSISAFEGRSKEVFDFKFCQNLKDGKRLVYFHSIDLEKLIIGSISIDENSTQPAKKLEVKVKNERGINFKIYPLSDESLLLETQTLTSTGYEVIPYAKFK